MYKLRTLVFLSLIISMPVGAESFSAAHLGFTLSKSTIGFSYASGANEINAGLKSNPVDFWGRYAQVQPGVTLNRDVPVGGLYLSLTYAPIYQHLEQSGPYIVVSRMGRSVFVGDPQYWKEGWNSGEIFLGLGKSFQFTRWGIHLDANLITPVTDDLGQSWAYWIGAGASYRFKLD